MARTIAVAMENLQIRNRYSAKERLNVQLADSRRQPAARNQLAAKGNSGLRYEGFSDFGSTIQALIATLIATISINLRVEMSLKSNQSGMLTFCLAQQIGEPGFQRAAIRDSTGLIRILPDSGQ